MMINVLENLRLDHACLLRMINQSSFGGAKTDVRVREPEQLAESLSSAIAEIERWQKTVEHFRQEVGKLHSQLGRKDEVIARLREALERICEATPRSTNSTSANEAFAFCAAVGATALYHTGLQETSHA